MTAGDPRRAARAIDALRRGWPVGIGPYRVAAVESWPFDPGADRPVGMILSDSRAATLKLINQRDAASPGAVGIILSDATDAGRVRAIADPALDLDWPLKGPFAALPLAEPGAAAAALDLARRAGLLPAGLLLPAGAVEAQADATDLAALADPARLMIAARARLPVKGAEDARIVAFRAPDDPADHVALVIGRPDDSPPLVRLHSECLTGDVLGSLKCDCGPQLHEALHRIEAGPGWGILLYLRQEGRGIGLVNKLRAYALQDQGFDTVDANVRLGFAVDARDYAVAARMLALLGAGRVRLLTNNPGKVAGLVAAGVTVVERVPLILPPNPHNRAYLATKRDRTGHRL